MSAPNQDRVAKLQRAVVQRVDHVCYPVTDLGEGPQGGPPLYCG